MKKFVKLMLISLLSIVISISVFAKVINRVNKKI